MTLLLLEEISLRSLPKLHHFVFVCRELPFPLLTHEYQPAFAAVESMFFFYFFIFFFIILYLHFLSLSFVLVEFGPAFATVLFHPRKIYRLPVVSNL